MTDVLRLRSPGKGGLFSIAHRQDLFGINSRSLISFTFGSLNPFCEDHKGSIN